MADRITDLEIGHQYAPSFSKVIANFELVPTDSTPANIIIVGLAVFAAYTIVWNLFSHR